MTHWDVLSNVEETLFVVYFGLIRGTKIIGGMISRTIIAAKFIIIIIMIQFLPGIWITSVTVLLDGCLYSFG